MINIKDKREYNLDIQEIIKKQLDKKIKDTSTKIDESSYTKNIEGKYDYKKE
ncbi:MAG: hypothetical protein LBM02_01345 [Lachnospiraceae bacterium]|jgi:hypothetical protein|nr:hypothetical protein [Lachnospiraceae bacterium]